MTAGTIRLGGTAPLSGPEAARGAFVRGASAYFSHVNARGGVHGRAIDYVVADDAHDPVQALAATRQLVEQDGVFALFGQVGTEQALAARGYLNARRVPQLFAASGATALGRDWRRFPWTIGFEPSHRAEGWIYGAYLARARPGARVAVLHRDDEEGRELLAGLRQGLARSRTAVVAIEPYDPAAPDVPARVAALRASGATVLALFATPGDAARASAAAARLGWRPPVVVDAASASPGRAVEGAVSLSFVKDPSDPAWRDDPGIGLYRAILSRHARGANAAELAHVHGMAAAYEVVRVLRAAGKEPTRAAVLAQLGRLSGASNPFLLPGIHVRTTAGERFPVEQALLRRWSDGRWRGFGGLFRHRAG